MRLSALVERLDHVCCRYRLNAFRPLLAARGHHLDLHALPSNWWQHFRIGTDLSSADAVILQRKLLPGLEFNLLRRRVPRLIFDFDDAIWMRDSYSAKGFESSRRIRRLRSIIESCDAVVTGNDFLAEQARLWAVPSLIRTIPTCIDANRYPLSNHDRPAGLATLVWIGSSSTLRGLEAFRPTLERIGLGPLAYRFKLICNRFFTLRSMPVIPCPWSEASETAEIAASDIGISWLPDDPWSRGKCGLKVLQYMAAGLPVVANPVGVQAGLVRHGETGFLARSEDEWIEAVETLTRDTDLRREMGAAGRRLVEEEFSLAAGTNRWTALLGSLAKHGVPA